MIQIEWSWYSNPSVSSNSVNYLQPLLGLWGNKNWPSSIRVKKPEKFSEQKELKGLQMVQIEWSRYSNPLVSTKLGIERLSFSPLLYLPQKIRGFEIHASHLSSRRRRDRLWSSTVCVNGSDVRFSRHFPAILQCLHLNGHGRYQAKNSDSPNPQKSSSTKRSG